MQVVLVASSPTTNDLNQSIGVASQSMPVQKTNVTIKCATCRINSDVASLNSLRKNYALMDLINSL